jgi:hypothetical protein
MGGSSDAVSITNWSQMQDPLGQGVQYGVNQVWMNQQANADKWATQAKANDDAWRAQQQKNTTPGIRNKASGALHVDTATVVRVALRARHRLAGGTVEHGRPHLAWLHERLARASRS